MLNLVTLDFKFHNDILASSSISFRKFVSATLHRNLFEFSHINVSNMVRTKADRVPSKAVASKAPRKGTGTPGRKNNARKNVGKSHGGGNPYHPRETPEWQKPITSFMNTSSKTTTSNASPEKEKIENQATSNCADPNTEESAAEEDSETD